jgi:hypothetical protein
MGADSPLDSTFAVLKAIRTALLSDATLGPMLAGSKVLTEAPHGHATPYIQMTTRSNDFSTASEDGQEVAVDLHVWHEPGTQTPETGTAREIMGHIRRILHTAALALDAPFNAVQCRIGTIIGPYRDPDEAVLHGVVEVRVLADHT